MIVFRSEHEHAAGRMLWLTYRDWDWPDSALSIVGCKGTSTGRKLFTFDVVMAAMHLGVRPCWLNAFGTPRWLSIDYHGKSKQWYVVYSRDNHYQAVHWSFW
jgi:hypothetical protein